MQRPSYGTWPIGLGWSSEKRDPVVDPRIAQVAVGYEALRDVPAGQEILTEYPLVYTDFATLKKLPGVLDEASCMLRMAYDLLARRVGGQRLSTFLFADSKGKLRDEAVHLVATDADLAAIEWLQRRFRGLHRKVLIVLLKAIETSVISNVSPVLRLVVGMGLYECLTAFEHSCEPSARLHVDPGSGAAHLVAIRAIRGGEKITMTIDEEVQWRATRRNRWKMLGLGRNGYECPCDRCQKGRPYDDRLEAAMRKDQSRMPASLRGANLENVLDSFDRDLGLGKYGIFAVGEVWNRLGASEAECSLIRLRFGRAYVNSLLQLSALERDVLVEDPTPESARIADVYEESIDALEHIGFLGRRRLVEDRVRLQTFRAFLALRSMGIRGEADAQPRDPKLAGPVVDFLVAYSAAMCMAEDLWGSTRPLVVEAIVSSEPMRAIIGFGGFIVNLIAAGKIH